MNVNALVFEGIEFEKIKLELIACINAFGRLNTLDLAFLTFIPDSQIARSVCPVLIYDFNAIWPFEMMYNPPTEDSEITTHFDPITVSPPFLIHPNKVFLRDVTVGLSTVKHPAPICVAPSSMKKWLNDERIAKMEIVGNRIKFFSKLGFEIQEDPIFSQSGNYIALPLFNFSSTTLGWRKRGIELLKKVARDESVETLDKAECALLYDDLNGERVLKCGIKVYPDFVKQKPNSMKVFSFEDTTENVLTVCLELALKDICIYVFYTYTIGW